MALGIDGIAIRIGADLGDLTRGLSEAGRAIGELAKPAVSAANLLSRSFDVSLRGIERALIGAANTGKFSFRAMVDAIAGDLARLAIQNFITRPLGDLLTSAIGSALSFGGARASGGPVTPGRAYVVGERGPELFVPRTTGAIVPASAASAQRAAPSVVVNIHAADAQSVLRSESQVAAMLSRALARGARNL